MTAGVALAVSEGLRNKVLDLALRRRGGVRLHVDHRSGLATADTGADRVLSHDASKAPRGAPSSFEGCPSASDR